MVYLSKRIGSNRSKLNDTNSMIIMEECRFPTSSSSIARNLGVRLERKMATVSYPHLELNDKGKAIISGTRTKVVEVALDWIAHNWGADEIQRNHPHLSLGQIHCALAYYFDHQSQLDREIEDQLRSVEQIESSLGGSVIRSKLQGMGHSS